MFDDMIIRNLCGKRQYNLSIKTTTKVRRTDADVPIQACGNNSCNKRNYIPNGLPCELAKTLEGEWQSKLSLEGIYEDSKEHINSGDKKLRATLSFHRVIRIRRYFID